MYSGIIKFIIALSGLFPILLIFWIIQMAMSWKSLSFYLDVHDTAGIREIWDRHCLLLIFIGLLLLCKLVLWGATHKLSAYSVEAKSIKPADPNFLSVLLSYLAPWFKVFLVSEHDYVYVYGFFFIAFALALITSTSYQYNISFRLFFGYRHFEVQSTSEVTYLVLSKTNLVNKAQITQAVKLTDYLLINTTPQT